jgi:hypothetical protein
LVKRYKKTTSAFLVYLINKNDDEKYGTEKLLDTNKIEQDIEQLYTFPTNPLSALDDKYELKESGWALYSHYGRYSH